MNYDDLRSTRIISQITRIDGRSRRPSRTYRLASPLWNFWRAFRIFRPLTFALSVESPR
jgi:hypothetical protein